MARDWLGDTLDGVLECVRLAGERIVSDISRPKEIVHKGRIDLVTATDRAVEEQLKEGLARLAPQAGFWAEESSPQTPDGDLVWIIDPVDGTTNFAHGLPAVCTSVALWQEGRVVLGVVNAPVLGECLWAVRGRGCFVNGQSARVSETASLVESLVATGFPYAIERHIETIMADMRRVLLACRGVRRFGSAALDLAYTALGRFEGFYETGLKPWDTAAGWLLVEEAGGRVSQHDGQEPYRLGAETILASNGRIHSELATLLGVAR